MGVNVNCIHCGPFYECLHPDCERTGFWRILGKHPGCHMVMQGGTCTSQQMYPRPQNPPRGGPSVQPPPPPPPVRIEITVKGPPNA